MFNINDYLDKFKNLGLSNKENKKIVLTTIFDLLRINLDEESLKIKDGVIIFRVNSVIKNSIYIKKSLLIDELKKKGIKVYDIR